MGKTHKETKKITKDLLSYLERANVLINRSKCILKPNKKINFLGLEFTSKSIIIPKSKRETAIRLLEVYKELDPEQRKAANGFV